MQPGLNCVDDGRKVPIKVRANGLYFLDNPHTSKMYSNFIFNYINKRETE
jgi:hypothetical protein